MDEELQKKLGNITIKIKKNNYCTTGSTGFKNSIEKIIEEEKNPETRDPEFTIDCKILNALKDRFKDARVLIKNSIKEGRPIFIRHHADTDGYTGAIALEDAIHPLISKFQGEKEKWFNFDRAPSPAPFYEYRDVLKDLMLSKRNAERFNKLDPLIILVDNGSTSEDLLSIKKAKLYNLKIIVVDHHFTEIKDNKSVVDDYVDVHINPYLVGGNKNITAGMLAYELALQINPTAQQPDFLPALAGTTDRSTGNAYEQYLKKTKKSKEELKKLGESIDYEAHHLKYMQSAGLIKDLLKDNRDTQKLIDLLYRDIEEKKANQLKALTKYNQMTTLKNNILMATIDIEKTTLRGEYPGAGKSVGILNDSLKTKHPDTALITIAYGSDFITLRASETMEKHGFNNNKMIEHLQKQLPYALIEGGGHEVAGSIKFIEASKEEILKQIRLYLEKL